MSSDGTESKIITQSDLSEHSSSKDCWISVHGVVMDVTKFLDEHPGGAEVIVSVSGRDCSAEFEDIGHTDSARRQGTKYIIGRLEGHEETPLRILTTSEAKQRTPAGSGVQTSTSLILGLSALIVGALAVFYNFVYRHK